MPGTNLETQSLVERLHVPLEEATVVLLLSGQVVVDLPGGAFRVLDAGHSLVLAAGAQVQLQPIGGPAVLVWAAASAKKTSTSLT